MDVVDLVVLLVLVAAALHGLRLGALVQVFSLLGFVLGMTVGALLTDVVVPTLHTASSKTVVALLLVLGIGIVFGVIGRIVGTRVSTAVRRRRFGPIHSALGVGVALLAALLGVWLVGNELDQTQNHWLSSEIQRSGFVRAVDHVLPPLPDVFSRIQSFLGSTALPPVFSELEPAPAAVAVPTAAWAANVAGPAEGSTVKVLGQACGYLQEGTGFVVARGLVATNAHVVAGEPSTQVIVQGAAYDAVPVYFDPTFDLAILRTAAPLGPPLTLDPGTVGRGTEAAVVGYPENGPLTVGAAAVADQITAAGRNIFNEGTVTRQVYQIDATVAPGNSGGPLVAADGEVVGVVFSRSTVYQNVGYALTSPDVLARVQRAEHRTGVVSTGACTQN